MDLAAVLAGAVLLVAAIVAISSDRLARRTTNCRSINCPHETIANRERELRLDAVRLYADHMQRCHSTDAEAV